MMSIRPATPADALAIATVHNASREATYREFLDGRQFERLDDATRAVRWQKLLGDEATTTLVAEEQAAGGRVLGFINYLRPRPRAGAD